MKKIIVIALAIVVAFAGAAFADANRTFVSLADVLDGLRGGAEQTAGNSYAMVVYVSGGNEALTSVALDAAGKPLLRGLALNVFAQRIGAGDQSIADFLDSIGGGGEGGAFSVLLNENFDLWHSLETPFSWYPTTIYRGALDPVMDGVPENGGVEQGNYQFLIASDGTIYYVNDWGEIIAIAPDGTETVLDFGFDDDGVDPAKIMLKFSATDENTLVAYVVEQAFFNGPETPHWYYYDLATGVCSDLLKEAAELDPFDEVGHMMVALKMIDLAGTMDSEGNIWSFTEYYGVQVLGFYNPDTSAFGFAVDGEYEPITFNPSDPFVTVGPDGKIWYRDLDNNLVVSYYDPSTGEVESIGGTGWGDYLAVDPDGTVWLDIEDENYPGVRSLASYNPDTGEITRYSGIGSTSGIQITSDGKVWLSDYQGGDGGFLSTFDPAAVSGGIGGAGVVEQSDVGLVAYKVILTNYNENESTVITIIDNGYFQGVPYSEDGVIGSGSLQGSYGIELAPGESREVLIFYGAIAQDLLLGPEVPLEPIKMGPGTVSSSPDSYGFSVTSKTEYKLDEIPEDYMLYLYGESGMPEEFQW